MTTPTLHEALQWGRDQLSDSASCALDCELLLAYALQTERTTLWREPKRLVLPTQYVAYQALVAKRRVGMPIAYLTGVCEFWSLPLDVNPAVLVPRPETEHVVESLLACFPQSQQRLRCLELGTGSGAIALALAHERPHWSIVAVDASHDALHVAQANAQRLGLASLVQFVHSDWYQTLTPEPYDCLVSNPPYVAAADPHLQGGLRFEPQFALIAGEDGYGAFREIICGARPYLVPGGTMILEHGLGQAEGLINLLNHNGFTCIDHISDLQGILRVIVAKMI